VLLYLVDSGANRSVTTITSVSGGSIANAVVGKSGNFKSVNLDGDAFRRQIRPLLDHITRDGLFFYGSATNGFLATVFWLTTVGLAATGWILGVLVWQVGQYLLDLVGVVAYNPTAMISLRSIGVAIIVAFAAMLTGTWVYSREWNAQVTAIGLVGVSVGVGLIIWDVAGSPIEWSRFEVLVVALGVALTSLSLAGFMFGRRSGVAEQGMKNGYLGDTPLSALDHGVDGTAHIICASEMQSGLHAFFSGSFVYSYQFGISLRPDKISLARAVQSSAALPGAFGPRKIETVGMDFENPDHGRDHPLILMDGGVYDNMADQWFIGLDRRRQRWGETDSRLIPPFEDLIVANASTGWEWKPFGQGSQKGLSGEIAAFSRVNSLFYNTIGRRRRAHLMDWWASEKPKPLDERVRGVTVEVNDNPVGRGTPILEQRLTQIEPTGLTYGGNGEELAGWPALVEQSRSYPTVLRRIREPDASYIMWHAYLVTALAADRFLDIPVTPESLPDFATFQNSLAGQPK
jgi:hypothetical protein